VLPYLTEQGFANELKLKIHQGDIIQESQQNINVLVSEEGGAA
jgi:hypothetical protein